MSWAIEFVCLAVAIALGWSVEDYNLRVTARPLSVAGFLFGVAATIHVNRFYNRERAAKEPR